MHMIRPGAHYNLPPIPRLLDRGCHPRIDALECRHDEWLRRWYPFATAADQRRFFEHRSTLWTAATYPATDDERFYDLARLTSFLFALDDLCLVRDGAATGQADAVFAEVLAVLSDESPSTAHGEALADVWAAMRSRMLPRQRSRLVAAIRDFGHGCRTEMISRASGVAFDLQCYAQLRVGQSLAAWIYFILTEYAAGVELDPPALDGLSSLHATTAEHLLFANDLFSFRAEHFADDHVNAVCVLVGQGRSLQEAVNMIASRIVAREREFVGARDQILASPLGARQDVRAYVTALEYVTSGNLEQSRFAPRYHGTSAYIAHPIEAGQIILWADHTEYRPVSLTPPVHTHR